ncbi:hypothetical protein OS580_001461 [Escherichia coli]|nr:hypothetical protein [Escherichia coli]
MTYRTLQLDKDTWDLMLDESGDLAVAEASYSVAQDVASACLVFYGECWYDNTLGIPWKSDVLGKKPTTGYIAHKLEAEARKIPVVGQTRASVFFDRTARRMRGTIRVTDTSGNTAQVNL